MRLLFFIFILSYSLLGFGQNKAGKKPLLIARGSEPGWYAEFFNDHLDLTLDYGKTKATVKGNFSTVVKVKSYKSSHTEATFEKGKITKIALAIVIDVKTCTEEGSGEQRERTITLKYNGKTYKGCATNNN